MTEKEIYANRVRFISELSRNGMNEKFMQWLEGTDFFEAPASTKYHGAEKGGLCAHSLAVASHMEQTESAQFVALVHDICKENFYIISSRNVKDEDGHWQQVPYYAIEDQLPMGHGEKSLYLVTKFFNVTDEEAAAIRWHMGTSDASEASGKYAITQAFDKYPLAVKLHIADLTATFIDKK